MTTVLRASTLAADAIDAARSATQSLVHSEDGQTNHAWIAFAAALLEGGLPHWWQNASAEIDDAALEKARVAVERAIADRPLTPDEIAAAFEQHLEETDAGTLKGRRNSGAYFTPTDLVDLVVRYSVGPLAERARTPRDVLAIRILDPAVGTGGFLLSAGRLLTDRIHEVSDGDIPLNEARRLVVEHCLYGADANPLAALLTAAVLRNFAGEGKVPGDHIQWADTLLPHGLVPLPDSGPPLDTRAWSPDGAPVAFDAVVGNPPWGAVKPAIREFFALANPVVLDRQGIELRQRVDRSRAIDAERWNDHSQRVRAYAGALRESGWYQHQGRGDADLYRYFIERSHQLLSNEDGRLGLLVPAAFLRADGATPLRQLLLDSGSFEAVIEFINSERIFAIHSMFRFAMLIWQAGTARGLDRVTFGIRNVEAAEKALQEDRPTTMAMAFISRVSGPRRTIPDLRSHRETDLFDRLYRLHPMLDEMDCGWRPRFVRELDMTNDSRHFIHAADVSDPSAALPLYEGRMVHQFDSRAKRYEGGAGRRAIWSPQALGQRHLAPHYYVGREVALDAGIGFERAGFCDITGHANERTILAALIPADAVAGNKVPTVRFDRPERELHLIWLALSNSFVIDWIARRRVATSLNFFQLAQLPFPRVEPSSALGRQMVELTSQLSRDIRQWSIPELVARADARARLDALVAACFELDLSEFALLLVDFPLLDRHQPISPLRRRSTTTRDLVLLEYARLLGLTGVRLADLDLPEDNGPSDLTERVAWARGSGQIAYIPGEHAKQIWANGSIPISSESA